MVKSLVLILTGFIIFFGTPTLESRALNKFCESGEPEEINSIKTGEGEIKNDSIYTARSWLIHVNEVDNSGIDLNIKNFSLETFFLVIQDGDGMGRNPDSMIQLISGQSNKPLLFRIPFAKSLFVEICPEYGPVLNSSLLDDFTMSYKRTVYEDEVPEEKPDVQVERESYEVQLKGKPPEKYKDFKFVLRFKEAIKNLARDYCKISQIDFDEEKPADKMITILTVRPCPVEWYDRQICASVKHSVYVTHEQQGPTAVMRYELRRQHLQEMWKQANDSYFEELELSIYKFPNKGEMLGWWFLLIVAPSIILVLVTISVLKVFSYVKEDKHTEPSTDSTSVITTIRKKSKMKPDKYQYVPPNIKNKSKTGYSTKQSDGEYMDGREFFAALIFSSKDELDETKCSRTNY